MCVPGKIDEIMYFKDAMVQSGCHMTHRNARGSAVVSAGQPALRHEKKPHCRKKDVQVNIFPLPAERGVDTDNA